MFDQIKYASKNDNNLRPEFSCCSKWDKPAGRQTLCLQCSTLACMVSCMLGNAWVFVIYTPKLYQKYQKLFPITCRVLKHCSVGVNTMDLTDKNSNITKKRRCEKFVYVLAAGQESSECQLIHATCSQKTSLMLNW